MSSKETAARTPLGSRPRVLARRSLSARQPARDPKGVRAAVPSSAGLERLRNEVWGYWKKEGRHELPWRKTKDPYKILVSEVMLQQTQVSRVIGKYRSFLKKFPTVRSLASASLAEVLEEWSGLGYNRRAKFLRDAAVVMVEKHGGCVPTDAAALRALPGLGAYTTSAVRVFAWNLPDVLIETNVRTVFFHHWDELCKQGLHKQDTKIADAQLLPMVHEAAVGQDARTWHWALMDYGAHLKQSGVKLNAKSAHYTKQSKFEGSLRQMRGEILRQLRGGKQPSGDVRLFAALKSLANDGLIVRVGKKWKLA